MFAQDNNQLKSLQRKSSKQMIEKPLSKTQREIEDSYNQFNNQISTFQSRLSNSSNDFQQYLNSILPVQESFQKTLKPLKSKEYGKIKKNSYYNKNLQHFNFTHSNKNLQTPQHIPIQKIPLFNKKAIEQNYRQKNLYQLNNMKEKLQKYNLPQIDIKADNQTIQSFIDNQNKMNQILKETVQNIRLQRIQNSCSKSAYSKIDYVSHENQQQLL